MAVLLGNEDTLQVSEQPKLVEATTVGCSHDEEDTDAVKAAEKRVRFDTSSTKKDTMSTNQGEMGKEPSCLMQALLCAAAILEGVDTQLLGVCMFALQNDIGFVITDLAILTVVQGVSINIAAPFWGIIADRGYLRRRNILFIGAIGQGIVTISLAFVTVLWPMILLRTLVGCLLAALRPISNGIIADMTSEDRRGKLFGRVQCSLLMGMFLAIQVVGNMARKTIFGFNGWRVAFVIVGLFAIFVGVMIATLLQEPERQEQEQTSGQERQSARCAWVTTIKEEIRDLTKFLTIPTFLVMIMQGVFGTIPWTTMSNMLLYFQLSGIEDAQAVTLTSVQPVAGAIGNLVGGYIADFLARRCGYHGRPLSAQITVAFGIPAMWLIFGGVPAGDGGVGIYLALICVFGILGSWAQSGTNFPILSEIVPASSRSRVMAWECALENSLASLLGPPVVTNLAIAFGYTFGADAKEGMDLESAAALGKAMQATVCLPWCITLAAYSVLHFTYPRDVRRLAAQ